MSVLQDMRDSYGKECLIPFLGAGFSKNIPGYPDWEEFIQKLEDELDEDTGFLFNNFNNDMLEATEYFILKMSERYRASNMSEERKFNKAKLKLASLIRDSFRNIKYNESQWALHNRLIKAKKINQYFTTNWDNTIEISCKKNNISYEPIIFPYDFKKYAAKKSEKKSEGGSSLERNQHVQIIKFHGDSEEAETIIACETDYYERMTTISSLDIKFKNELLYHDFLFLGYSFRDINVKYILYQMNILIEQISPKYRPIIFFVSLDKTTSARMELFKERRGIYVFYLFELLDRDFENEYPGIIPSGKFKLIFKRGASSDLIKIYPNKIEINEIVKFNDIRTAINADKKYKLFDLSSFKKKYKQFIADLIRKGYNLLFDKLLEGE